jgi:hypothetical protein
VNHFLGDVNDHPSGPKGSKTLELREPAAVKAGSEHANALDPGFGRC